MIDREHIKKVHPLLDSLLEHKSRYIEVLTREGDLVYKMKLILEPEDIVKILDNFFDDGFIIKEISKEDFDGFSSNETFNFRF